MKHILFVCTGNTCRSPMAEAALRHYAGEKFEVKSAGVYASDGSGASYNAKEALGHKGIDMNHMSQQLTKELLDWADVVLTMTNGHKRLIVQSYPDMSGKTYTMYEFIEGGHRDISDPFGGPLSTYQATLDEIEYLLKKLVEKESGVREEGV